MTTLSSRTDYRRLAGAIFLCELIGISAGLLTIDAIREWYVYLRKPDFNPPGWVFAPVWSVLYLLMGLAFYNILRQGAQQSTAYRQSLALFWVQLTLNFLWTMIFFGLRNPQLAFVAILMLIGSICFWVLRLQKVHRSSAYLQIPYLLWCCFAMILNYYIIQLN